MGLLILSTIDEEDNRLRFLLLLLLLVLLDRPFDVFSRQYSLNNFVDMGTQIWWILVVINTLISGVSTSTPPPNHVVLNQRQKHIDTDSAWLDKHGQKVERVRFPPHIVGILNQFIT